MSYTITTDLFGDGTATVETSVEMLTSDKEWMDSIGYTVADFLAVDKATIEECRRNWRNRNVAIGDKIANTFEMSSSSLYHLRFIPIPVTGTVTDVDVNFVYFDVETIEGDFVFESFGVGSTRKIQRNTSEVWEIITPVTTDAPATDDSEEPEDDTFDRVAFYRQHPELIGLLNPKFDDDEEPADDDAFGNLADYRYENAKDK